MGICIAQIYIDPLFLGRSALKIVALSQKSEEITKMREQVEEVLNKVRPSLVADGGDIELVDIQGGQVKVRLLGACHGCPMSQMTLKAGVERAIMAAVPGVTEVVAVPGTPHQG
jgi:Fe-S cluster biogenesis protein NfuA